MTRAKVKTVNLALQGGGAHGAFAWGVLDQLLEDGRLEIDGLSATSAGAMNATVYAYGKMQGGTEGAREALKQFWFKISEAGKLFSPVRASPFDFTAGVTNAHLEGWSFMVFEAITRAFSPYEFNPLNVNPLRDVLQACVDFDRLRACRNTRLFISTTNVRSGRARVFANHELSLDVVLASACLPFLFQAVEIGGATYWDGGYAGNPALFPLFYHTESRDIVILHINPVFIDTIPRSAIDIADRVNEITFNASLLKELRAIAFVNKMLEEDWIKDEFRPRLRHMLVHSIRADEALADAPVSSKFNCDWRYLCDLRDRGRETASAWLAENYIHIGKRGTVDLRQEFLGSSALTE